MDTVHTFCRLIRSEELPLWHAVPRDVLEERRWGGGGTGINGQVAMSALSSGRACPTAFIALCLQCALPAPSGVGPGGRGEGGKGRTPSPSYGPPS